MSLDSAYNLVFAALVIVMLVVVYLLFAHLSVGDFAICAALFLFSPYTTRLYIRQTTLVEATVFMIGVGICLLGLRRRSSPAVVGGLIVAVLGRQTAILVAPVAAVWVLADPGWRAAMSTRRARSTAISAMIATFGIYIIIKMWAAGFSGHFEPSGLEDSILGPLRRLPSTAMELGAHFARTAIPLVIALAVVAALAAVVGWRNLTVPCWAALAMAAAIAFQPLVTDPNFPGAAHNEQRQAALAILPLAYAVGELLSQTVYRRQRWYYPVLIVGLLAASSLHHEYATFGAQSMTQFVVLQVVVAIAVGLILFRVREPADRTGVVTSARP